MHNTIDYEYSILDYQYSMIIPILAILLLPRSVNLNSHYDNYNYVISNLLFISR